MEGTLLSVMWKWDGRGVWGRMGTRICMSSFCCLPETITILLISSTSIKNKKLKKPPHFHEWIFTFSCIRTFDCSLIHCFFCFCFFYIHLFWARFIWCQVLGTQEQMWSLPKGILCLIGNQKGGWLWQVFSWLESSVTKPHSPHGGGSSERVWSSGENAASLPRDVALL